MLAKNDIVELKIDSMSSDGKGIGRYKGMAVFVPLVLPGENASVRITKVTSSYAVGEAKNIYDISKERSVPECPVYGRCGGCDLMHIDYASQLEFKRRQVADALGRIGGFRAVEVKPVLGMEEPWRYRNKAVFSFAYGEGKTSFGCFERRSHNVISLSECKIQFSEAAEIMDAIAGWADRYDIFPYSGGSGRGLLRHAVIRKTDEGIMAVLATTGGLPRKEELIKAIIDTELPVFSIINNINAKDTDLATDGKNILLYGKERLAEKIGGLTFSVSAESFLQVNPVQTGLLYGEALRSLGLSASDNVIDLFCGVGTLSLLMAKNVSSALGIESVQAAVNDAKLNARLNGIANAEFICGSAEKVLPELVEKARRPSAKNRIFIGDFSALTLDPPRRGAEKQTLDAIIKSGIRRIAYLSCDPATLARDCKYLCSGGYRIVSVQPVDMFPQTHHVETVCSLRLGAE